MALEQFWSDAFSDATNDSCTSLHQWDVSQLGESHPAGDLHLQVAYSVFIHH